MVLSLNFLPIARWQHGEFAGPDPWADGRPVVWSVVVYRMVGESFANAVPKDKAAVPIPKALVIGIHSQEHGRYRILPLAMQELWREGRVRDEDLPWLLHQVESRLWVSDYPPARVQMMLKAFAAVFITIGMLACGSTASGFVIGAYFAIGSCLCLLFDLYLRERKKEFARTWPLLLAERPSGN